MSDDRARRRQILRQQHLGPRGAPAPASWRPAMEDLDDIPFGGVGFWRQVGPGEIDVARGQLLRGAGPDAGDVLDIAVDPAGGDAPTICVATNGGVWKSEDGGAHWRSVSDTLPTSAIGAVAVDLVDDVIYAGTRNLVDGSGVVPRAMGVFRSNDGGGSWAPIDGGPDATVMDRGVNRIICPSPGVVLVGCPNGLFLSVDGGASFGANAPDFNDLKPVLEGFVSVLEVDPSFRVVRPIVSTHAPGGAGSAIEVKCIDHGFLDGEGVSVGGTEDNEARGTWLVRPLSDLFFELRDSEGSGTDSTRGVVIGPNHPRAVTIGAVTATTSGGAIRLTVPAHGLVTGDVVVVREVTAPREANGSWRVKVISDTVVELVGSKGTGSGSGGTLLAPPRPAPAFIQTATNGAKGIELRVADHHFANGDRVSVSGIPGIDPATFGVVTVSSPHEIVVSGMKSTGAPSNATVNGPAAAWNMAYVAVAGRAADGKSRAATRGLYRVTLSGAGPKRELAISKNLLAGASVPTDYNLLRFAQSTSRPRTLYVAVQDTQPSTRFIGLLRSDDLGETWKRALVEMPKGVTTDGTGASDDAFTLGVDPQDDSRVYLGFRQWWRSVDGGATFPQVHVETEGGDLRAALASVGHAPSTGKLPRDHHAIAFMPATHWPAPGTGPAVTPVYVGTAGGIARSDTGGDVFVPLNHRLATSDLLAVGMRHGLFDQSATFVAGPEVGIAGQLERSSAPLVQSITGAGAQVAVDPWDRSIVYGFVDGRFVLTVNGGEDWQGSVAPARPVVTALDHQDAVSVDTLGHSFLHGEEITVSEVRSGGTLFDKVNGRRKVSLGNDVHFVLDLPVLEVEAFPPFDPVAAAVGKRFPRRLAIVRVTGGSPIKIETASEHDIASPIEVHVQGVVGVPGANNDAAHPTWTATRVSDTELSLDTTSPAAAAVEQDGARIRFRDLGDKAAIQFATFHGQDPIVITALNHGFLTGSTVSITGVRGNTNANVTNGTITVIDHNCFRLDGVAGNGAWGAQPAVQGKPLGRNLPASTRFERQRLALLRNINPTTGEIRGPSKTIFASVRKELYRSDDEGHTFSRIGRFDADVTAIACRPRPIQGNADLLNVWVGLASGKVHSGFGRDVWRGPGRDTYVPDVGARGAITGIVIDHTVPIREPQHVVVVASGYADLHAHRGTHHVFETVNDGEPPTSGTDAGVAWKELGGPRPVSPGTTPDLPILGAAFLEHTEVFELVVATDGGVLRHDSRRNTWRRVGPNLPNVSCQALTVDTLSDGQSVVQLATAGRGVWHLERPQAPRLFVRGSLGFGDRPLNRPATLTISVINVGRDEINIAGITSDVPQFVGQVLPAPFPLKGDHKELTVTFTPSQPGLVTAVVKIEAFTSTGPSVFIEVPASGVGVPAGLPRVCVRSPVLRFGRVTVKASVRLPVTIRNTGTGDAEITILRVTPAGGPFTLVPGGQSGSVPFPLKAGGEERIEIEFLPKASGAAKAKLEIRNQPVPGGVAQPPQTRTIEISGAGTLESAKLLHGVMATLGLAEEPATAGA